jgi:hypothetical protein
VIAGGSVRTRSHDLFFSFLILALWVEEQCLKLDFVILLYAGQVFLSAVDLWCELLPSHGTKQAGEIILMLIYIRNKSRFP